MYVPLSAEGEEIRRAVRAPIQKRQPVGYRREFMEDYQPNVTYYLPAETRRRLREIGHPPDGERPAGTYARTIYSRLLIDRYHSFSQCRILRNVATSRAPSVDHPSACIARSGN